MKKLLCFLFLIISNAAWSQSVQEKEALVSTVKKLFDAMRAGDSTALRSVFAPSARLMTTFVNQKREPVIREESIDQFVKIIGSPHERVFDEKIWRYDVAIDENLAMLRAEYTFFLGDQLSHCGVDAFHLFKSNEGWKIIQITDTRRKENCQTEAGEEIATLNRFLDNWHKAAAEADEDTFFGSMSEDAVYLGTDASEKWRRDEMREWSKKYFERESAWAFTPSNREIYLSDNGKFAWFDESLDTWMGICRGSGVLQKYEGNSNETGWKIRQYNLAVTVPNELIKDFIDLVKKGTPQKD